uniref:C2H2-type domain-containing protein n=1 Tax=Astyanax mexicanus TaxID=7994 RepID=A0A3B1ID21_ASTMX
MPDEPVTMTEKPVSMPEEPVTMPEEPVTMPEEPVTMPEEPVTMPEEPVPLTEEPVPLTEEPVPMTENLEPMTEESVPMTQEPVPLDDTKKNQPYKTQPKKEKVWVKCPNCPRQYTSKVKMQAHKKVHHRKGEIPCHICGLTFIGQCQMTNHLRVHTGEKPFSCSFCSRCFPNQSQYNKHLLSHTAPDYTCEVCGLKSSQVRKSLLKAHLRCKEPCSNCQPVALPFLNANLENIKLHGMDYLRVFFLDEGLLLLCKSKVSKHIHLLPCLLLDTDLITLIRINDCTVQLRTKPFRCEQCGKRFTQRTRLITHRRIHTGEKPYHCQLCGKMFSRQDNCLRHVRLHSGQSIDATKNVFFLNSVC